MTRANPKLVLIGSILISLAIAYWGIAFNKATIKVESNLDSYQVEISESKNVCKQKVCSFKVKPRSYTVLVNSIGYTELELEIKLERGETYNISYEPIKLPEITEADTNMEEYIPAQLRRDSSGEQNLWIDLGETLGEEKITRFPNPLLSADISVSPSLSVAMIADSENYWLVDVVSKSKVNFNFSLDSNPDGIRLITDELAVIKVNSEYKIYNIITGDSSGFPIEDINHVIADNSETIVVISKNQLDKVVTNKDNTNLLRLLTTTGEDLLKAKPQGSASLYFYLSAENKYIKISDLEASKYGTIYKLKHTKNNIYLETNKGDFLLNL